MKFIKYLTLVAIVAAYANLATAALDDSDINTDAEVTTVIDTTAADTNAAADLATANFAAVNKSINESLAAINAPAATDSTKPALQTTPASTDDSEQIWVCKPAKKNQTNGNGNGSKRNGNDSQANGNGSTVTTQVEPTETAALDLDEAVSDEVSAPSSDNSF
jgi:hypothetical protein